MEDVLYQESAEGTTRQAVAERFAESHWAQPREIETIDEEGRSFTLVNGIRTYYVNLREQRALHDRHSAPRLVYQITYSD